MIKNNKNDKINKLIIILHYSIYLHLGLLECQKAAMISHLRFIMAGYAFKHLYSLKQSDTIYIPLPLYHSNGGIVGISSAFHCGMNIIIRNKFSATNYFKDCSKLKATVGIYIGECCRYVLNTPPSEYDTTHNLRLMIGNGLSPDIWENFVNRFKINIGEFYGSTEGNAKSI